MKTNLSTTFLMATLHLLLSRSVYLQPKFPALNYNALMTDEVNDFSNSFADQVSQVGVGGLDYEQGVCAHESLNKIS